jgi:hypothetical protein
MHKRLISDRFLDLSQDKFDGDTMISAKFLCICGILMATIAAFSSVYLVVGSLAISAYNAIGKPSNATYIASVSLLLIIAARAAWIMQGVS